MQQGERGRGMNKQERKLDLANEAVSLIKEFRELEATVGENIFKSIKVNTDGSKIIVDHIYEGILEYKLTEISTVFSDEIDGFGPVGSGFYDAIYLEIDNFENAYEKMDKKDFIDYVGKVYFMKFRCEEIYEKLKLIEKEFNEVI